MIEIINNYKINRINNFWIIKKNIAVFYDTYNSNNQGIVKKTFKVFKILIS